MTYLMEHSYVAKTTSGSVSDNIGLGAAPHVLRACRHLSRTSVDIYLMAAMELWCSFNGRWRR